MNTVRAYLLAMAMCMLELFRWQPSVRVRDLRRGMRRAWYRRLARAYGLPAMAGGATLVAARSPLYWQSVKGGIPAIVSAEHFTGNIFYVDSAAASASDTAGYGYSPDKPFATLNFAITQCTANQGDVIFCLPGHAESINTAGGITCDKAGVSIIGLGEGEDRPTITVGTSLDTATILISAADVKIKNLIVQPGNDGVDVLVDINADGAILEGCEIRSDETNAYQFDTGIDINGGSGNAADRVIIRRCKIMSIAAGAVQGIEIGAVEDGIRIEDNWILGDFSVAGIHSGSILTNCLIARNYIHNVNAGDWAIELTAAATGLLADNRLYADAAATCLDPGSMMCVGNQMVNAIDQSSISVPTTAGGVMPTGAIGAASFAAGAIDATAIANDAIDATAIATGAIDADAIADNAIDAGAIAGDAITNAKIADNALASEQFALSAGEKTTDGIIVTRATAALPQTAVANISP